MTLYLTLALAAVVAARFVARYDLYDREPWPVVAGVIVVGGIAMAAAGPIEDALIQTVGGGRTTAVLIAAVAASVEEVARFAIVLGLALMLPRHFNDPMDGLVYGSAAGIGMALEETAAYLAREAGAPLAAIVPVEAVRLFGHVVMGGITGFGIGLIYCRREARQWRRIAAGCLVVGVLTHFVWDYVALVSLLHPGEATRATGASIALVVVSMGLYGVLVVRGSRASRDAFAPDSGKRVWQPGRREPARKNDLDGRRK